MEFYQLLAGGAVVLIIYSILIYLLKKRWGLKGDSPTTYSKLHKDLRLGLAVVAILGILFIGFGQVDSQNRLPLLAIPFVVSVLLEALNIYMQIKHGENPKWIAISWISLFTMMGIFIATIIVWMTMSTN
ncbi:hypothetical protein JOD03_001473 [Chryseomicrobium aureum]|uniref:hypothetical protein n=1 Tax=Chryseomicrobium aureum TaxID=1441723 RepID=UPI001956F2C3|nr:hypothetical protein [Chryseomicrobium aureum]MBM7706570.1 hypothetical protein [Chryseomicrobium aureum]